MERTISKLLSMTFLSCVLFVANERSAAQLYQQTNLVSDQSGVALHTDPNLVNAWGLTRSSSSPFWVSDNGTGVATLYDGNGIAQPLIVTIAPVPETDTKATPTGAIFYGGTGFQIKPGFAPIFLFATEDGTISGWNPNVNPTLTILVKSEPNVSVFKGLTIATTAAGTERLYVADFRKAKVLVLDSQFKTVTLGANAFVDQTVPPGFAPFNVQNIGGNIYVAYAQQDAAKLDPVSGAGLGFVSVFSPDGTLIQRLAHGNWFNAPWGMTFASADFGSVSHDLLVGQFLSGEILVFNPVTGAFKGKLLDASAKTIVIDGLWGLVFGNGGRAGPANTLFFTAGPDDEAHGLFGKLTPLPGDLIQGSDQ